MVWRFLKWSSWMFWDLKCVLCIISTVGALYPTWRSTDPTQSSFSTTTPVFDLLFQSFQPPLRLTVQNVPFSHTELPSSDPFPQSRLLAFPDFYQLLRSETKDFISCFILCWLKKIFAPILAKLWKKFLENCSGVLSSPSFYDNKKQKLGRLKVEEQSLLGGNL